MTSEKVLPQSNVNANANGNKSSQNKELPSKITKIKSSILTLAVKKLITVKISVAFQSIYQTYEKRSENIQKARVVFQSIKTFSNHFNENHQR